MAKYNKESLFNNFFDTAAEVFPLIEAEFGLESGSICDQLFGINKDALQTPKGDEVARGHVKSLPAWSALEELYDYAVDGLLHPAGEYSASDSATTVVIRAADILKLLQSENVGPSDDWFEVLELGDARFGLDDGNNIELNRLALLAGVDHRTVRNAVSARELETEKFQGRTYILNKSALKWLRTRKGYTPTRYLSDAEKDLSSVSSATEFGAFLADQRKKVELDETDASSSFVNAETLAEIEAGVFTLPIDSVYALADFYMVERNDLLDAVMRIFFAEQLKSIVERHH
ncbi:MAG: hypothetical protein ABW101_18735 [Candidatus Thiodiazotropha sp.]